MNIKLACMQYNWKKGKCKLPAVNIQPATVVQKCVYPFVFSQMFWGRTGRMWEVMGLMKMSWIISFLFSFAFPFFCAVHQHMLACDLQDNNCCAAGASGSSQDIVSFFWCSADTSGVDETNCCSTLEVEYESREIICKFGFDKLVHSFQKHSLKMYSRHE